MDRDAIIAGRDEDATQRTRESRKKKTGGINVRRRIHNPLRHTHADTHEREKEEAHRESRSATGKKARVARELVLALFIRGQRGEGREPSDSTRLFFATYRSSDGDRLRRPGSETRLGLFARSWNRLPTKQDIDTRHEIGRHTNPNLIFLQVTK